MRGNTRLMEVNMRKYTSRESTRVEVRICMEGISVKQKTRVLTHRNLPIKSIALHYINIQLVDQHNVTYGLFGSAYVRI